MPQENFQEKTIGKVVSIEGSVSLEFEGQEYPLQTGSPLYHGAAITTHHASSVEILFQDQTVLHQGADSRSVIDDFFFTPTTGDSRFLLNLTEGALRIITGEIAARNPQNFSVKTPLSTIGIRGTDFMVTTSSTGDEVIVLAIDPNHVVLVSDPFGSIRILNFPGTGVSLQPAQPIGPIETISPDRFEFLQSSLPITRNMRTDLLPTNQEDPPETEPPASAPEASSEESPQDEPSPQGSDDESYSPDDNTPDGTDTSLTPWSLVWGADKTDLWTFATANFYTFWAFYQNQFLITPQTFSYSNLAHYTKLPNDYIPVPTGKNPNHIFLGSTGNDLLIGGPDKDLLLGFEGDDTLYGGADDDTLEAWTGHDLLNGQAGNDNLWGWQGNDTLYGGEGDDSLRGEEGNDLMDGGPGDDLLIGDTDPFTGDDTLYGDSGDDTLDGVAGCDLLVGGPGNDHLSGGPGDDILEDRTGSDFLYGESGNDLLSIHAASLSSLCSETIVMNGGPGSDTISLDWSAETLFHNNLSLGSSSSSGCDFLSLTLHSADTLCNNTFEMNGGWSSDTLSMHLSANTLSDNFIFMGGDTGDDTITLSITAWQDFRNNQIALYGGSGDDIITIDIVSSSASGRNTIEIDGGPGFDTISLFHSGATPPQISLLYSYTTSTCDFISGLANCGSFQFVLNTDNFHGNTADTLFAAPKETTANGGILHHLHSNDFLAITATQTSQTITDWLLGPENFLYFKNTLNSSATYALYYNGGQTLSTIALFSSDINLRTSNISLFEPGLFTSG